MHNHSEDEFEALEDRVDRLADEQPPPAAPAHDPNHRFDPARNEGDFEVLVREALDGLPDEVLAQLGNVPVIVSDQGAAKHSYGEYEGFDNNRATGVYADFFGGSVDRAQIFIFRDTLVHDFGHDLEQLREQVTITVRHEVAHLLGFNEAQVRRLGL